MLKGTHVETIYYRLLEDLLIPPLVRLRIKPNHLTVLGLVISLVAGVSFAFNTAFGGILTLLTGLVDTLDGCLARAIGETRKDGAFLDSVLDRYTELLIYLGIWAYFYRKGAATPVISLAMLFILFGSLMVSYTRARAEGLGQSCIVGLLQRGERIIAIALAGIFNPMVNNLGRILQIKELEDIVLFFTLVMLAIGTNLTALRRFLHVLKRLRS